MKINFHQQNQLLTLEAKAIEPKDKNLLHEFFQQEIPGYDHSLHYEYSEPDNRCRLQFVPTLTHRNLEKEYGNQLGSNDAELWLIDVAHIRLEINKYSGNYTIRSLDNNNEIESGNAEHIYKVRQLVKKMNGYAGTHNW